MRGYTRDTRESDGRAQINYCTTIRTLPRVECVTDCVADKQKCMASVTNKSWEFGEFQILEADATEAPVQGKVKISRHSKDRNCYHSSTSSGTVSLIHQDDATS